MNKKAIHRTEEKMPNLLGDYQKIMSKPPEGSSIPQMSQNYYIPLYLNGQ